MKNLLNCHSVGLHSFPLSLKDGLYRRVFYADKNHNLWKTKPFEIAIHPHHVDIKIKVLDGVLFNSLFEVSEKGKDFQSFVWDSHILNGNGGFKKVGTEKLLHTSIIGYEKGDETIMKSCELHTVYVPKGDTAVWVIEEEIATCGYNPINYSNTNLEEWKPDGLYIEVDDEVKNQYIGEYLPQL